MMVSFKMGTSTRIVGKVFQDQLAGLAGTLKEKAQMIPVNIKLDYFKNQNEFNYNIIRSYFFLPKFLTIALFYSIEQVGGWLEKNTLNFNFEIIFDNNKVISLQNSFASLSTSESIINSMKYLLNPLSNLMINKFKNVRIKDIKVKIKIDNKIKIAEIISVKAMKKEYEPGETLNLKVKLKPYKGEPFDKKISIKLPINLPQKKISLFVSSDQDRQYIDFMLSPYKFQPQDFKQLVTLYNELAKSTDLSVWTFLRDKSIIAKGEVMDNLPASYYSLLQNSLESGMEKSVMQIKNRIKTDHVITGAATVAIEVKKKLHDQNKFK